MKVVYAVVVGEGDADRIELADRDPELDVAGLEPRRLAMMDSAV